MGSEMIVSKGVETFASVPTPARSGMLNNKRAKLRCSITNDTLNAPAIHSSRCLGNLPDDVKQTLVDWLPTYQSRTLFQMTCKSALRLDRNAAPPRIDTFFGSEPMEHSAGMNVYLRDMRFGDRGAHAVAQALQIQRYDTVVRLNLGNNCITDDGAVSIADAIMKSTARIKRIYLDGNKISDIGARSLVTAAASHGTLVELDLRKNSLTVSGSTEIGAFDFKENNKAQFTLFSAWNLPSFSYMAEVQTDIDEKMRCILADWMFDVVRKMENYPSLARYFPDLSKSYFLAISFLDRYLSLRPVARSSLQKVGVACLLVAFRPDLWSPGKAWPDNLVSRLTWFADHCFTPEALTESASEIRDLLHPEIQQPSAYDFYVRYVTWTGFRNESLLHDVLAAAAVLLTFNDADFPKWHKRLLRCSSIHATKELIPCARKLLDVSEACCRGESLLVGYLGQGKLAATKKFSLNKFFRVAKVEPSRASLLFLEHDSKLEIKEQNEDSITQRHDENSDDVAEAEAKNLEPSSSTVSATDWTLTGSRRRSFPYRHWVF